MAARRRKATERREPRFDAAPGQRLELRLTDADRPAAPAVEPERARRKRAAPAAPPDAAADAPEPEPEPAAPAAKRSSARKPANDDRRGTAKAEPRERRAKPGRGRGGGPRPPLYRRLAYWAAVLALWGGIAGIGIVIWAFASLPPIQSLEVPKRPPSVTMLSLDGRTLATRGEMGGAAIGLEKLPEHVKQAFVAIEDRRFFGHFGLDLAGVARAVFANLMHRGVAQGGSTITQQLAKNLFLTQDRTVSRKLQELALALWLEHKFSKSQILELYLNRVYFGAGAYGVESAAQRYFAKSARGLTVAEAAMLAGLVKSPSKLAPTRNPEGARQRAALVVAAMAENRFISKEIAEAALASPARVAANAGGGAANYVADWVMDALDDLVGRFEEDLIVETTVDPALQAAAEKALAEELAAKGERFAVGQGALVAMTPDGAVRALVGGRNYAESQFNRAVAAKRQPGSAFKPFVYLTALERGLTPETLRDDRPLNVRGWQPENYGREYFGAVSLTRALAQSLNTVAVRLILEVGAKPAAQTAHRLGIASKLEANASLALGTSEVTVLELVSAYAPFANGGIAIAPHVVRKVRAGRRTLYQHGGPALGRVVEARHIGMMNAMLQETIASGTARNAGLPGWQAAGKTGTSQDFRDAWFIGYTANLVTGVWLGNDDNSPTRKTTGGGLPVEIWSRFMKVAHQGVPPQPLPGLMVPVAPPAAVVAAAPGAMPTGSSRPVAAEPVSLDQWLLEKVFGRR